MFRNRAQLLIVVGIAMLVLGGAGLTNASYQQSTNECESGTLLSIDRVNDEGTTSERIVSFAELSPTEQLIFLESFTSENDISDVYQPWSPTLFNNTRIVTYRGSHYEITEVVNDCANSLLIEMKIWWFGLSLGGIVTLILTGAWQILKKQQILG